MRPEVILAAACVLAPASARDQDTNDPLHPQITEVLFNVPAGSAGDANKDGERHSATDEFIEIANPHDEPIDMQGYVLFNRRSSFQGGGGGVRFAFPSFTLPPHAVCVVFNGGDAAMPKPFGTPSAPPESASDAFSGAFVFSIGNASQGKALANAGDWIALAAPTGQVLDVVSWGSPDPPPPAGALRTQSVEKSVKGSVQRTGPRTPLEPHHAINGAAFSPGVIPAKGKAPSTR